MNRETDRERLAELYAAKSNDELIPLVTDPSLLTDADRLALAEECARRGIDFGEDTTSPAPVNRSFPDAYSGPLVMVKRFYAIGEAFVAKSALDSAGIDSLLTDEDVVQLVYPNLVGGLKLMVRPDDLEIASQILNQPLAEQVPTAEETQETDLTAILRKAVRRTRSGDEKE